MKPGRSTTYLWFLALTGSAMITGYGMWTGSQRLSDFAGYYTASRMVLSGSGSSLYDDARFVDSMQGFGIPESTFTMYVNPPLLALVMAPVAWMAPSNVKLVWNCINIVLLAIAFELLRRMFSISWSSPVLPFLAALLACTLPILRNLQRGQIYVLLFDILLLIALGYRDRKPFLTAGGLAVMILLKFFGLVFLILFAIERRWKELFLTILFVSAGTAAGLLIFGIEAYESLFTVLLNARNDFGTTGLPCVPALTGSLFSYHPQWNTHPVSDEPMAGMVLNLGILMGMLFYVIKQTTPSLKRFSAFAIIALIFTPLAADHHYILMALPAACLILAVSVKSGEYRSFALVGALLFFVLGWYPQPLVGDLDGWSKLFAFPRLYAAIAMGFVLLKTKAPQIIPQSP